MDTATAITELFNETILPLGICVGLPIGIVWLSIKKKINETNKQAEIVKLAIENNTQVDMSKLIPELNEKRQPKGLKYRLLTRLQLGGVSAAIGLGLLIFALWQDFCGGMDSGELKYYYLWSLITLFVGLVVIIIFFVSKNLLKEEMEAECKSAQKD